TAGSVDVRTVRAASTVGLATSPARNLADAVGLITDANGFATTFTQDPLGRQTRLQTADGATWQDLLEAAGQATATIDPNSNKTFNQFSYGAGAGDLTRTIYPDGSSAQFQYDSTFHKLTQYQDPRGNTTTATYNSTGDPRTVTD